MKRGLVLGTIVALGALSVAVSALQQSTVRAVLPDLEKVRDNLYMIAASTPGAAFTGGNTGVFISDTGVAVIDTKLAGYGPDILEKIRQVTEKPVVMIINTHTHADHTGSNVAFLPTVDIIAHENTKANMIRMDAFKNENALYLPKRTYQDKMSIFVGCPQGRGARRVAGCMNGKDQIDLYYFGPGHTDGDSWVMYPGLRVLQTGDMFAWKDAPLFDRANGGSGVEYPKTLAKAIAGLKDFDLIIPGHSPLMAPKDLQEYQRYTADLLSAVQTAKSSGKSLDEATAAAMELAAKYPDYKTERVKGAVQALYDELDGK